MHKVTVGSKYRVTIPPEIRESLDIRPGQVLTVVDHGRGGCTFLLSTPEDIERAQKAMIAKLKKAD